MTDDKIKAVAEKIKWKYRRKMKWGSPSCYISDVAAACKEWMNEQKIKHLRPMVNLLKVAYKERWGNIECWQLFYTPEDYINAFHAAFCKGEEDELK